MKQYSIDIHAHPTLKPYSKQYPGAPLSLWDKWTEQTHQCGKVPKLILNLAAKEVSRSTQTALEQAARGKVKIIGVSLFTFEAGWTGKNNKRLSKFKRNLLSCLTGISENKLQLIHDRIDTGIYEDTLLEYYYLVAQMQQKHMLNGEEWEIKFLTRGILQKIVSGELDPDTENVIYLFINIEGVQSLGIASMTIDEHDFPLNDQKANAIKERINGIKNSWHSIPQYITPCHHFGNGLIGHAPSIPFLLKIAGVNQDNFVNRGIEPKGKEIIRQLLGDLNRQILVDIKHFSPRARHQFYEYLEGELGDEFGTKTETSPGVFETTKRVFPILCTHTGFINGSDMMTLKELVEHTKDDKELVKDYLNNSTINMCREDLIHIKKSKGLIGVQIDLKRLAGKKYLNLLNSTVSENANVEKVGDEVKQKALSCEIVWANVFTAAALLDDADIWDILCIGSDYDGIVSFLPGYPTMAEYKHLKNDMKAALEQRNFTAMKNIPVNGIKLNDNEITRLMGGLSPEEITERLFTQNALKFWAQHFTDQVLPEDQLVP